MENFQNDSSKQLVGHRKNTIINSRFEIAHFYFFSDQDRPVPRIIDYIVYRFIFFIYLIYRSHLTWLY